MATAFPELRRISTIVFFPPFTYVSPRHLQVKMSPRAALKKVHQAAARQPAGGSGKRPRTQTGKKQSPGTNLENLEAQRSKTSSRNVEGLRGGGVSGSRRKQRSRYRSRPLTLSRILPVMRERTGRGMGTTGKVRRTGRRTMMRMRR